MQTENSFEVVVRKKIPYLTTFLHNVLMICLLTFFLLSLVFLPAKNQSNEMEVAYFISVVPEFIKYALVYSGVGYLIILFLYQYARMHKKAVLTFSPEEISIVGKNIKINIPINTISKVFSVDSETFRGDSKQESILYFERRKGKTVRVKLKYYVQADEFIEQLEKYENINLKFYNYDVDADSAEE